MVDPSITSPGAVLRRCREYHALSLEEVEESTKIGANYLIALEEDQVRQFSSLAYLKGFLRIYSTYLGLNPDDMIRLYEKLYSANSSGGVHSSGTAAVGDPAPRRKFPLQKLAMPAVILVLQPSSTGHPRRRFARPGLHPPQYRQQRPPYSRHIPQPDRLARQ